MKYKKQKDTRECKPQGNFPGACYNARKEEKEKRESYPTIVEAFEVLYGWI
jgi:hypothetical protein